jgi:uncharacterized protein (TIGR02444 family)
MTVVVPAGATGGAVELDADDFWSFSLRVYGDPTIRATCLALQDSAGADVNILLLLLYAATRHVALGTADISRIDQACSRWRAMVVGPLRTARRAAVSSDAPNAAGACSSIEAAELAAEKVAQTLLLCELNALSRATTAREPIQLAEVNVAAYGYLLSLPDALVTDLLRAFARCSASSDESSL